MIEPLAELHDELVVLVASAVGLAFTTTAVVPLALVHPPAVTVTLYVPAIGIVAPVITGFWLLLV